MSAVWAWVQGCNMDPSSTIRYQPVAPAIAGDKEQIKRSKYLQIFLTKLPSNATLVFNADVEDEAWISELLF